MKFNEFGAILTRLPCLVILFWTQLTKLWSVIFVEGTESRTCTSKVFVVTLETGTHLSRIGSVILGYSWSVPYPSWAQLNLNALSAILILCPLQSPWLVTVIVNLPVIGL